MSRALTAAALLFLLLAAPVRAAAGPALSVDAAAGQHAISNDIYGMNFAPAALAKQIGLPVDRNGGNSADTYNWQEARYNTSSDYYFEILPDCWTNCANPPADPSASYRSGIAQDVSEGAKTLLDLPMTGYVAHDAGASYKHPFPCSYPTSVFPTQDSADPYQSNCGNGQHNHARLTSSYDPTRTGIAWGPDDAKAWIADIRAHFADGQVIYELGNEPDLYQGTHPDWHQADMTNTELRDRSVAMATAVKQADPAAQVLGFDVGLYIDAFCDRQDIDTSGCSDSSPDHQAAGADLAPWFLAQMKSASDAAGHRLLDYFDIHEYPQGGYASPFDATRQLWDPTFHEPNYIGASGGDIPAAMDLIPRMKQWVAQSYPGTKTSISEYDFSSLSSDPVVQTLLQAEVLGIFGREGLDLATRWNPPQATDDQANAWRIFRDYDGAGGRFGDQSVSATSADQSKLAIYAATRSSDGALTVLLINKTTGALTVSPQVAGFAAAGPAQRWDWSGQAQITRGTDVALGSAVTLSGDSMALLVAPPSATTTPPAPATTPPVATEATPGAPATTGAVTLPGHSMTLLVAPAGAAAKLPAFAKLVTLPKSTACASRRHFTIRLRVPKGVVIKSATVTLGGKRVAVRKGKHYTAPVDLRTLPKGRFTIKVTIRLTDGRKVTGTRHFHTCAATRK